MFMLGCLLASKCWQLIHALMPHSNSGIRRCARPATLHPVSPPDDDRDAPGSLARNEASLCAEEDLPPIVARMVIEIRSDGRTTIARGALEDRVTGQTVQVQADAASPLALSRKLASAVFSLPSLARLAVRGLVPRRLRRLGRRDE
jgi:hypothetical protein